MRVLTIARIVWLEVIRRKDLYVLLILLGALLVTLVSLNIFGLGAVTGYVMDVGLLMAWVFGWILTVTISARQLPAEEGSGTVFPLLAKPITRGQVVVGKWLGSWSIASAATFLFYLLVVLITWARGKAPDPPALVQGYLLHCAVLAIIAALAVAFSTRMNADAAGSMTYVLTAACFLVVPRIPEFLTRESGVSAFLMLLLYNVLPHFEVFDMRKRLVHDWGPAGWGTVLLVLAYGALLATALVLIAWLMYRRKRFSRS